MNWNNWCLQNWLSVFSDVITPIKSGKRPLDSATNIITYMSLAKEFWNQKHAFIENQLKYKQ